MFFNQNMPEWYCSRAGAIEALIRHFALARTPPHTLYIYVRGTVARRPGHSDGICRGRKPAHPEPSPCTSRPICQCRRNPASPGQCDRVRRISLPLLILIITLTSAVYLGFYNKTFKEIFYIKKYFYLCSAIVYAAKNIDFFYEKSFFSWKSIYTLLYLQINFVRHASVLSFLLINLGNSYWYERDKIFRAFGCGITILHLRIGEDYCFFYIKVFIVPISGD
jgi:hypothetical protein